MHTNIHAVPAVLYSVVMPHKHIPNHLHLHVVLPLHFLRLRIPIRDDSALSVLLHRRRVLVLEPPFLPLRGVGKRTDTDVVVGHGEVEDTETFVSPLRGGRLDDAVDGGAVEPAGEEFEGVAGVDDLYGVFLSRCWYSGRRTGKGREYGRVTYECVRDVADVAPLAVGTDEL